MSKELINAFEMLQEEKNISKDIIIEAVESALTFAYKRNYDQAQNVEVAFDDKRGEFKVFAVKEVVDTVMDSNLEVSLEDALEIHRAYEIGDKIRFEVTPGDFGRIAAQTAKQVITQRLREAERANIYEEFVDYEDDLVPGFVERQDRRFIYVSLGRIEAVLNREGQIPGETFQQHDRLLVYVERVENTTKGPQIYVSRTHPNMIKRLFEQEVPEIYDGTVEIKAIAREAGDRSKIAVYSNDPNIDPVGTSVGPRGSRVQAVVNELHGENMDIIEWSEDPAEFISHALNPADVLSTHFIPGEKATVVVVPDNHLSLAIGKRGQNARLAAKLTGYKIDIKSESEWAEYQDSDEYNERFNSVDLLADTDDVEEVADTDVPMMAEAPLAEEAPTVDEENLSPDAIEAAIGEKEMTSAGEAEADYDTLVEEEDLAESELNEPGELSESEMEQRLDESEIPE
ncbi:MAG: transcription termination factor NusA [Aerococcus sp.]|nr:transcription termination factor NusA [Aerococcus sp.]